MEKVRKVIGIFILICTSVMVSIASGKNVSAILEAWGFAIGVTGLVLLSAYLIYGKPKNH